MSSSSSVLECGELIKHPNPVEIRKCEDLETGLLPVFVNVRIPWRLKDRRPPCFVPSTFAPNNCPKYFKELSERRAHHVRFTERNLGQPTHIALIYTNMSNLGYCLLLLGRDQNVQGALGRVHNWPYDLLLHRWFGIRTSLQLPVHVAVPKTCRRIRLGREVLSFYLNAEGGSWWFA